MTGPLKSLARHCYLKKHVAKNDRKDSISPDGMSTATIFIDGTMQGTVELIEKIHSFFSGMGIRASVYALLFDSSKPYSNHAIDAVFISHRDINWYGRIKTSKAPTDGDLFISLLSENLFAIECAVKCSGAALKIGCCQEISKAFDIFISGFGGLPQNETFTEISKLLQKIK